MFPYVTLYRFEIATWIWFAHLILVWYLVCFQDFADTELHIFSHIFFVWELIDNYAKLREITRNSITFM
jgi:hypothetical protein